MMGAGEAVKMDKSKLVKVLNMMDSSFENEQLTALKLAHKLVKESGQTWEQLLNGRIAPSSPHPSLLQAANRAGFNRGYQAGVQAGRQHMASQIEAAYKRGVKETMDKASDPAQVKHLMEQAYEKGRAFEREQIKKATSTTIFSKKDRIKWDAFALNALQGKYGQTTSWQEDFLRSIIHFPRVSDKQLGVLHRMADDLGFKEATIIS